MYILYCRIYQKIIFLFSFLLPWRKPMLLSGPGSLLKLASYLSEHKKEKIFIVTDQGIRKAGLLEDFLRQSQELGLMVSIYDKTIPNPTIDNVEDAFTLYKENSCQAIIGFGGGSSIDCAKALGARIAKPKKKIPQMKGLLQVRKKLPLLIAVPTTSGTGSEATLAAVISNSVTHEKYALNDIVLIPHVAVLDPLLTLGLPKHITSTTGMDALTHAIEAYIGKSNTKETKEMSIQAMRLIFQYLETAYEQGDNLEAREKMQLASYYAGIAFTRAYVGYVHAIAHTLGGFYQVPHGLANAVILPYVLQAYGKNITNKLAEIYDIVSLNIGAESQDEKAQALIKKINAMNLAMNIPDKIDSIKDEDLEIMVQRALAEANPLYPVPKIMNAQELLTLYQQIRK